MKKFVNFLKRHSKKLGVITGVTAAIAITTAVAIAGFGPDRPTKVYNGPGTPGFDYVTYNSFTNVPNIGDERNFLTGKIAGAAGGFYDPMTQLQNNDEVLMRVYVHNNADPKYNANGSGIARNTKVRVELPAAGTTAQNLSAKAYISADNAKPQTIYDTLDMKAQNGGFFGLQYVAGSASYTDNNGTHPVSDTIVTTGANLGDQKGCFEYVRLVTFKAKVVMPRYSIAKSVRIKGQTSNDWKENVTVNSGQEVEWRIEVKNLGTTPLKSIKVVDEVPAGAKPVAKSVKLYNGNYPNGYTYDDSAIQAGGKQINVDIGNYNPGINAFVLFTTKVEQDCGTKTLVNKAFATPQGYGAVVDDASVTVKGKTCTNPTPNFEVVKDVRKKGDKDWKQDVTVEYGDTVEYRIVVKNTGDTDLKNVVVKDNRPTGVDYVNGTLKVNGQASTADLFGKGVTIAEIKKGAQAEVTFEAKVNKGQTDKCEVKKFQNIASAKPEGLTEKKDDANVTTECNVTPTYECSALDAVALGGNKYKFTVRVKTTGGATVNKFIYNFGDATAELSTDQSSVEHQYAGPGEYNVVARVLFNVGKEQKEARCTAQVKIPSNPCPYNPSLPADSADCKETPETPGNPPVTTIPQTGAAEVAAGIFGTSATAYGVISLVESRRALKNVK